MMDVDFKLMNSDCCVSELLLNWPHSFKSFPIQLFLVVMYFLSVCGSNLMMFFFSSYSFERKVWQIKYIREFSKYLLRQFKNYPSINCHFLNELYKNVLSFAVQRGRKSWTRIIMRGLQNNELQTNSCMSVHI